MPKETPGKGNASPVDRVETASENKGGAVESGVSTPKTMKTKSKTADSKSQPKKSVAAKSKKGNVSSVKPKSVKKPAKSTKTKKPAAKSTKPKKTTSPALESKKEIESNPKSTLKVSNQIPKERRAKIERSLSNHKGKKRSEWDRAGGVKQHRFLKKRIKPGTIRKIKMPLLDVTMGDDWATPVTVIHGARPGPVVTVTGAVHGDELVGPLACSMLCQETMIGIGKALDAATMAGTVRIAPILNPPGFRRNSRYFPDGRDLNREFPGRENGNTTQRVASHIWDGLVQDCDYLIDLHTAARGRTNLPQIRADLVHPESNRVARAFGLEVILDSKGPRGTLRRVASDHGIGSVTYEGGGANFTDHEAVKVAVYGVLNVLRSLHVIPGHPSRPRFRLLASGSTWVRADEGGLVDMFVSSGSFVEKDDIIGRIMDPQRPGESADILSPERGLLICTANNPFVTAGTPVGHLLPINRGVQLVKRQLDAQNRLIISGSADEPPWRDEAEVDEIAIEGSWSGGAVDAEWQRDWAQPGLGDAESLASGAANSTADAVGEEESSEEEQ
jgi:predicted deacylase